MVRRLLCVLLLVACMAACADGGFTPRLVSTSRTTSAAAQKAVLISEPGSEVLLLETTYRGPAAGFAWIIPVPETPQEVFRANGDFMDAILRQTSPVLVEHYVRGYSGSGGLGGRSGAGGGGSSSSVASPVRVLARMAVGDYEAVVLAADKSAGGQAGDVVQWLQDNGYEVSGRLRTVLEPYVKDHWVFVALKLQEDVAEEKPLLQDVPPVGLRFRQRGRRLVFPLHISRVSAPPFTAIALVTIGTSSYICRDLPVVGVEQETTIAAGQTYGQFRRKMSREPTPALLCECCAGSLPALSMSYREGGDVAVKAGLGGHATVTRYFAYLKPEEMEDLHLTPHGGAFAGGHTVLVERTRPAEIRGSGWDLPKALDRFTADCGALPCKLQDLLEAPTTGQDASGNGVPITGWHGPYLAVGQHSGVQPADLQGWVLDPLNISFWDRPSVAGTIRFATLPECEAAEREMKW